MEDVRLTEQEIDQARVAFLEFDKDNSGSIDQVIKRSISVLELS